MSFKFISSEELRNAPEPNAFLKLFRSSTERYWTNVSYKDHAATCKSEMHSWETDIYIGIEGEADLYLGGTIINQVESAPGQFVGEGLEGAEQFKIRAGDIAIIPENVPHMVDVRSSKLSLGIIKIDVREGALK